MLNQEIFQALEMKWGPFNVDLFAARHKKKEIFQFQARPRSTRYSSPAMDKHQTICIYPLVVRNQLYLAAGRLSGEEGNSRSYGARQDGLGNLLLNNSTTSKQNSL